MGKGSKSDRAVGREGSEFNEVRDELDMCHVVWEGGGWIDKILRVDLEGLVNSPYLEGNGKGEVPDKTRVSDWNRIYFHWWGERWTKVDSGQRFWGRERSWQPCVGLGQGWQMGRTSGHLQGFTLWTSGPYY